MKMKRLILKLGDVLTPLRSMNRKNNHIRTHLMQARLNMVEKWLCLESAWAYKQKIFNNSLTKCRTHLKYFSGARTKDLEHNVTSTLNKEKSDIVIIHIGSNDIDFRPLYHKTVERILSILVKNAERVGFRK